MINQKDFVNKEEIENHEKILSDFSEFLDFAKEKGITISDKIDSENKLLMNSDKKTYELLKIKNPKIKVLWEKFSDHSYYRCIILKDDNDIERVLAFSKTNLNSLNENVKKDIFSKKMPIGVLINKNNIDNKRIVYLPLKAKIENKTKNARAYIIKNSKGDILFNILEIFLR